MTTEPPSRLDLVRGLQALVHDAVDATADLVDLGHESAMRSIRGAVGERGPLRAGVDRIDGLRRGVTRGVLMAVKAINRGVEAASSPMYRAAERLERRTPSSSPSRREAGFAEAAFSVLNASVGDRLHTDRSPLEQRMSLRVETGDAPPGTRVVLFVHGLAMTERSWSAAAAMDGDFGTRLRHELGMTPVYLRYNTGRPVADNGRELADTLERFVAASAVPIDDLVLVGHSMGGLVLRSAAHAGLAAGHAWTARVRQVVCLGSPHRGAPLAKLHGSVSRALDAVDLPATQVLARLLGGLSAGIHDLEHGAVLSAPAGGARDEGFEDGGRGEESERSTAAWLPCRHLFVSATIADESASWGSLLVGDLLGDLLVRTASADGPPLESGSGPPSIETHRLGGVRHQQLTRHPAVYELLRAACREL